VPVFAFDRVLQRADRDHEKTEWLYRKSCRCPKRPRSEVPPRTPHLKRVRSDSYGP
jgi:hypothetical protein